jgi:hypothetical protein
MRKGMFIIAGVLFLFSVSLSLAAPNMDDGLWEITTTVNMPGMAEKSFTHTTCLSKEKAVPQTAESGCTIKDVKTQGNTISWTVVCKEGMSTSTGKVTYAGTTMDGVVETTVKTGGQTMTMKSIMKGKRIGACK